MKDPCRGSSIWDVGSNFGSRDSGVDANVGLCLVLFRALDLDDSPGAGGRNVDP